MSRVVKCDSVKCFNNNVIMTYDNYESEEGKYEVYTCSVCGNKNFIAVEGINVSSVTTDKEQWEDATYERMASERLQDYMEENGYEEDREDEAYDELMANIENEFSPGNDEFEETRTMIISEEIEEFKEAVERIIASREEEDLEEDEEDDEEE